MIIQSIQADNFRRYRTLEISDIPEKGVITISGKNEAGKSTISDILCFSLFGRTFAIDHKSVKKLVNWDADTCATSISFKTNNDVYTLSRSCSKEGIVSASLLNDKEETIAETPDEVDQKLESILGYDYDTFAHSFYLMQRELTTPDSRSIKSMAGVDQYLRTIGELADANKKTNQELDRLRPRYNELFQQIEDINLDETWLPELVDTRETLVTLNNDKQKYSRLLDQAIKEYPEDQPNYQSTLSRYNFFNQLSNILLPLTVVVWLCWAMLEFFPELTQFIPWINQPEVKEGILLAGLIIVLIYGASLFYSWWLDGKIISPLKKKAKEAKSILKGTLNHITQTNEDLPIRVEKMLLNIAETKTLLPTSSLSYVGSRSFTDDICSYSIDSEKATTAFHDLKHDITHQRNHIAHHQEVLHDAIEAEIARADEAGLLRKERNQIESQIKAYSQDIKVNDQAMQLLDSASSEFSEQFNYLITENSSRILPHFTSGRYQKVAIDKKIKVKIFSSEKDGYIDFDEVSSGTQRQIMLSLRFAMSEQLAVNKGNKTQFILLDEPFAFFDQDRTIETLSALPTASDVITQIWVFSQDFPEGIKTDKAIYCDIKAASLKT